MSVNIALQLFKMAYNRMIDLVLSIVKAERKSKVMTSNGFWPQTASQCLDLW